MTSRWSRGPAHLSDQFGQLIPALHALLELHHHENTRWGELELAAIVSTPAWTSRICAEWPCSLDMGGTGYL